MTYFHFYHVYRSLFCPYICRRVKHIFWDNGKLHFVYTKTAGHGNTCWRLIFQVSKVPTWTRCYTYILYGYWIRIEGISYFRFLVFYTEQNWIWKRLWTYFSIISSIEQLSVMSQDFQLWSKFLFYFSSTKRFYNQTNHYWKKLHNVLLLNWPNLSSMPHFKHTYIIDKPA